MPSHPLHARVQQVARQARILVLLHGLCCFVGVVVVLTLGLGLADYYFKHYSEQYQTDLAEFCTHSEIMDSILYSLFPNFAPWAGFHPNLTYRMKPYGDNHNLCTMEIIVLMRYPEGEERPADCPPGRRRRHSGDHDPRPDKVPDLQGPR